MKKHVHRLMSASLAVLWALETVPLSADSALTNVAGTENLPAETLKTSLIDASALQFPAAQSGSDAAKTEILYGDVNKDGEITDDDIDAVLETTLKACPQGDVNGDGVLDESDSDMIREFAWGSIFYFPVGKYYHAETKFLTRGEWIHNLVTGLNLDISDKSLQEARYGDLADYKYGAEITAAANLGMFDTGWDENFYPDIPVKRGFVAGTMSWALGNPSEDPAQYSMDCGWFEPDEDEFHDDLYVTVTEYERIQPAIKKAPVIIRNNTVLKADMTVTNDLVLNAELNLNGHKLNAANVVINDGGILRLKKGSALVSGTFALNQGSVVMDNKDDYLCITGDAGMDWGYNTELTAGTLEFKGNITRGGISSSEMHTVVFSGTKDQTLTLNGDHMNAVEVHNSDKHKLIIEKTFYVENTVKADGTVLSFAGSESGEADLKLGKPTAEKLQIAGEHSLSVAEFKGKEITLDGNAVISGTTVLNKSVMTVTGDLTLKAQLAMNGSTLHVDGDLISTEQYDALIMDQNNDSLYVGGETHLDRATGIKAGKSELCGDVYMKGISVGENHTVTLSGEKDVTVNLTDNTTLGELVIANSDKRKVIAEGALFAKSVNCGDKPLTVVSHDAMFGFGKLTCSELDVEGNSIWDDSSSVNCKKAVLNGSAEFWGVISFDGTEVSVRDALKLNLIRSSYGSRAGLTIRGASVSAKEITLEEGTVTLNHGTLKSAGDFLMKDGAVIFEDTSDKAEAAGSCTLLSGKLEGQGTVSCGGQLTVNKNLNVSGVRYALTGSGEQTAEFGGGYGVIGALHIQNSEKRSVLLKGAFTASEITADGKTATVGLEDQTFNVGKISCDLTIEGDAVISYNVDLNGHELNVTGNLYHSSGSLAVNEGKLKIAGDYALVSDHDSSVPGKSTGELIMKNDSDYVCVGGDFITMANQSELSAGILELKGDFTQYAAGSKYAFAASGTHKVILSGTEKQTVTFESYPESHFNYLEMTQKSDKYDFKNGQCWKLPGDANEDGSVDLKDVVLMRQALAGWDVTVTDRNVDVNGDGVFNLKDVTVLRRYLADGWDVTLK